MIDAVAIGKVVLDRKLHPRYRLASHAVRAGRIMLAMTNSREAQLVAVLLALPMATAEKRLSKTLLTSPAYLAEVAQLLRAAGSDYHWPAYGDRAIKANLRAYAEAIAHFTGSQLTQTSKMPFHVTSQSARQVIAAELADLMKRDGETT